MADEDEVTHEFARDAREVSPVEITLSEADVYALTRGGTFHVPLLTMSPRFSDADVDTWVDHLEIQWKSTGTVVDKDIREVAPEIFAEGVVDVDG